MVYNYLKGVSYNLFMRYAVRNGGLCHRASHLV